MFDHGYDTKHAYLTRSPKMHEYSYTYFRVGGSNITGEINYPPLHSVLNANSKGDKIFQRGPNISENFVPGGPKISTKLK